MSKLIGIAGKAGTGKSEVARILSHKGYTIIAFADALKRILKEVFDFSDEQLWGPSSNRNSADPRFPRAVLDEDSDTGKISYLTPREALQKFGSVGRDCYENIWVDYTMRKAEAILNPEEYSKKQNKFLNKYLTIYNYSETKGVFSVGYKYNDDFVISAGVVLSDVRFINEADAIRERGGKIFLVKRETSLSGKAAEHESENGLPYDDESFFDAVIDNSGDLQQLEKIVLGLI